MRVPIASDQPTHAQYTDKARRHAEIRLDFLGKGSVHGVGGGGLDESRIRRIQHRLAVSGASGGEGAAIGAAPGRRTTRLVCLTFLAPDIVKDTYTPDSSFTGTDTFTYTADDGNGGTDTATVTVYVGIATEGTSSGEEIQGDSSDEVIFGHGGNDTLKGKDGGDKIYGGAGDDDLRGGAGDDILYGEDGDDKLVGGSDIGGIDILYGGAGNDTLDGGAPCMFSPMIRPRSGVPR